MKALRSSVVTTFAVLALAATGCTTTRPVPTPTTPATTAPLVTVSVAPTTATTKRSPTTVPGSISVHGVVSIQACGAAPKSGVCPSSPLVARVAAVDPAGRVAAATESAADGSFRFSVPAGRYSLQVTLPGQKLSCPSTTFAESAGGDVRLAVTCVPLPAPA